MFNTNMLDLINYQARSAGFFWHLTPSPGRTELRLPGRAKPEVRLSRRGDGAGVIAVESLTFRTSIDQHNGQV